MGAPYEVDYCHCHCCRKHTGAPVSAFADCKGGVVEFTKGAPALYEFLAWRAARVLRALVSDGVD